MIKMILNVTKIFRMFVCKLCTKMLPVSVTLTYIHTHTG